MQLKAQPRYYLVNAEMLPEIFLKVVEAKELLKTGEAATVAEAVGSVGISRSAFYKYKDAVSPFQDLKRGQIATFQFLLRDHMGVLSAVLAIFAHSGANILTINQSIPINGTANVTVTAETAGLECSMEEFLCRFQDLVGVIRVEILAA
jgi:chorismate mutase